MRKILPSSNDRLGHLSRVGPTGAPIPGPEKCKSQRPTGAPIPGQTVWGTNPGSCTVLQFINLGMKIQFKEGDWRPGDAVEQPSPWISSQSNSRKGLCAANRRPGFHVCAESSKPRQGQDNVKTVKTMSVATWRCCEGDGSQKPEVTENIVKASPGGAQCKRTRDFIKRQPPDPPPRRWRGVDNWVDAGRVGVSASSAHRQPTQGRED